MSRFAGGKERVPRDWVLRDWVFRLGDGNSRSRFPQIGIPKPIADLNLFQGLGCRSLVSVPGICIALQAIAQVLMQKGLT